ncbi:TadE/TadG family type IV pilus assembly protein [uncultured Methylobacterium sp.]|uniref:TadE/TadG family type IV pilus assembly protein n=1 Tax=uncultured Methylobacterium sp. TaxID=157278 RepID=UPI0035C9F7E0
MRDLGGAARARAAMTASGLGRAGYRLARARSGQVAIIFGLAVVPMMFAAGAAVDYGRRNAAKSQLDAALDAAVLAVVSQKSNTISAVSLTNAETQFRAEAAKVPGVSNVTFVPSPVNGVSNLSLSATYTAKVRTMLSGMMKVPTMAIAGMSASQRNIFQYIDFYLLLDNSPSMGLAATDADVTKMMNATKGTSPPDGCAFACHKLNGNGTENTSDYYHVAQNNGVKLRIHVLRDAVAALIDKAKSSMTLSQQFRMETWTFSDIQTRLTALTTSLDQAKTDSARIDLAYSYQSEADNQTAYERAIAKMNATVPASGTGVTATSPIRFLFFVTDGVQDTPIDGSVSNPSAGNTFGSNRFISPIDPTTCKAMKDKGIRIGIVYTAYLPLYTDGFYNAHVKPFEANIPTTLKTCASDGLFFPVTTGGDITAAMLKLFETAVASVRITN